MYRYMVRHISDRSCIRESQWKRNRRKVTVHRLWDESQEHAWPDVDGLSKENMQKRATLGQAAAFELNHTAFQGTPQSLGSRAL